MDTESFNELKRINDRLENIEKLLGNIGKLMEKKQEEQFPNFGNVEKLLGNIEKILQPLGKSVVTEPGTIWDKKQQALEIIVESKVMEVLKKK